MDQPSNMNLPPSGGEIPRNLIEGNWEPLESDLPTKPPFNLKVSGIEGRFISSTTPRDPTKRTIYDEIRVSRPIGRPTMTRDVPYKYDAARHQFYAYCIDCLRTVATITYEHAARHGITPTTTRHACPEIVFRAEQQPVEYVQDDTTLSAMWTQTRVTKGELAKMLMQMHHDYEPIPHIVPGPIPALRPETIDLMNRHGYPPAAVFWMKLECENR